MMNDHVPDVTKLFTEELKMDLKEADIKACVSKKFMDFDSNVLSRSMVKELCAQDSSVVMAELKPPTVVKVAGGATLECRNSVEIDVRISTAAGTVLLTRVSCLVLDGDEDELLLGRSTLKDIGIDVDSC
ncbi:hypothetical protein PInf_020377 [Phytophthora infestans]|nr:hypothetical protein PInf_020377 [Phytophthora infestans]